MTASEMSWALREVSRLAGELDTQLARRLQLRPLDHAALGQVMSSQAPLGPGELSARLGISSGSGSELIDRLERAGHLQRHRDTKDRRRISLSATPDAVQSVLSQLAPLFAALDAVGEDFTAQEQEAVIRYLRAAAGELRRFMEQTPGSEDVAPPS